MAKPKLTEQDFQEAASELGVEVAAIKAVCAVEAPRGGFIEDDRVRVLFERHKFHKYTGGIYDRSHPNISSAKAGGYGPEGAHQYARFSTAFRLNPKAAMFSCSWGRFQIMGFNFAAAGFNSVDDFVTAMKVSEGDQLRAFVKVIRAWGLVDELQRHAWAAFAAAYNGSAYRKNQYDTKLAAAYKKHLGDAPPAPAITAVSVGHSVAEDLIDDEIDVTTEHSEPVERADGPATPPEASKSTPTEREATTSIAAIPPLPVSVPDWAKKIVGWGSGLSFGGLGVSFAFLRDNPQALAAVLNILKYGFIALGGAIVIVVIGVFIKSMWNAKLANDLNMARLHNYGNPDTKNIEFSGWKGTAEKDEVKF
jgi:hypothetical protein